MQEIFRIRVINWDKIQSRRKDVTNPSWFKVKTNFFENPDLLDFNPKQRLLWLYILCTCAKVNRCDVLIFRKDIFIKLSMRQALLKKTLGALRQRNIIDILQENDVTWTLPRGEEIREEEIRGEGEKKRNPAVCVERAKIRSTIESELARNRGNKFPLGD